MSLIDKVRLLTTSDIDEIYAHYDAAVETSHGSGDHWILMAVLDRLGFRTNSPTRAVTLAEEIQELWYRISR